MTLEAKNLQEMDFRANHELVVNGTLFPEDFEKIDDEIIRVAETELEMIKLLSQKGVVDASYTVGDLVAKYNKSSEMTPANVSMDIATTPEKDRVTFSRSGVPLPVYSKAFQLNERQIESFRKHGNLESEHMTQAIRTVAQAAENMCVAGETSIGEIEGTVLQGLTTFTDRNTFTISNAWTGSSADPVTDVSDMIDLLKQDGYRGPYTLFLPDNVWKVLGLDYSTVKGDNTLFDRLMAMPKIESIVNLSALPSGNVVLLQVTKDVVDLAVARDIVAFPEPVTKVGVYDFTVQAIMALRLKSDKNGNCGLCHATGA